MKHTQQLSSINIMADSMLDEGMGKVLSRGLGTGVIAWAASMLFNGMGGGGKIDLKVVGLVDANVAIGVVAGLSDAVAVGINEFVFDGVPWWDENLGDAAEPVFTALVTPGAMWLLTGRMPTDFMQIAKIGGIAGASSLAADWGLNLISEM